jgi:hypothetical protein
MTTEALAGLLLSQWRGLLMVRDELSGWIGGFDRYSQGKGGDVARWLEMHGGRSIIVDRKTGTPKILYIPRAAVSVAGGIQPEVLKRCLCQQYRENGLAARLLLAWPPRRPRRWTEADLDPTAERAVEEVLTRLYSLQPLDVHGDPQPINIGLTPTAKEAWISFYNTHAEEHADLTGDLSAAWSKLEGYAARLALVIHLTRWAANDPTLTTAEAVDSTSMEAGIRLSRWFGHEARRVYEMLEESPEARNRRRLVELIRGKGGSITARDLMRSSRQYVTADQTEAVLEELAKAGIGRWEDVGSTAQGGRPSRRFVLFEVSEADVTPAKLETNHACTDITASSGPRPPKSATEYSDDWGTI